MWEKFFKFVTGASFIFEQGKRNSDELKDLRDKHYELSLVVQRLMFEIERLKENESHEREKLLLKLENKALKPKPTRGRKS